MVFYINPITIMSKEIFPIKAFSGLKTPFYYYDTDLLRKTLQTLTSEAGKYGFLPHYAIKANANPVLLKIIASYGLGADCVSGGEVKAALAAGFPAGKIVFAGVGKADWEIEIGLDNDIFCFNAESLPELDVINEIAARKGKTARVALRVKPDVEAHTHAKITTGRQENKFGINAGQVESVIKHIGTLPNVEFIGLHFHIGSQITEMEVFATLCERVNGIVSELQSKGVEIKNLNFGGGLGIDYQNPDSHAIADFSDYFAVFAANIKVAGNPAIHFEPGRSVVAQCGSLVSRVLYVKEGEVKKFAILDAGFSDLIRPAMYDAYHFMENISSCKAEDKYDVVGPICESSDVFGKDVVLNGTSRGDFVAIRSAGAYGEVMASQYNLRELPKAYFSEDLNA